MRYALCPCVFASLAVGCASTEHYNPYTARKTLADDGQDRHYYVAPLGLIPEDRKIPSQKAVSFDPVADGRVYVISTIRPFPHRLFIYVEGTDGQLHPREREEDGCIRTGPDDQSVVVFTMIGSASCEDRAAAYHAGRLSRDKLELESK